MKYLLTTIMTIGFAFTGVQAQEANKAPQEKTFSKEERAAAKVKKENELMEAFKTAGLSGIAGGAFEAQYSVEILLSEFLA
jgi:hypothetical protein